MDARACLQTPRRKSRRRGVVLRARRPYPGYGLGYRCLPYGPIREVRSHLILLLIIQLDAESPEEGHGRRYTPSLRLGAYQSRCWGRVCCPKSIASCDGFIQNIQQHRCGSYQPGWRIIHTAVGERELAGAQRLDRVLGGSPLPQFVESSSCSSSISLRVTRLRLKKRNATRSRWEDLS